MTLGNSFNHIFSSAFGNLDDNKVYAERNQWQCSPQGEKMILRLIIPIFLEGLRRADLTAAHNMAKWNTGLEPAWENSSEP